MIVTASSLALLKQCKGKYVGGPMSTSEPEPRSCWECNRGKILCLPDGGKYVDCPPANWKWHSCMARLLDTIENPFPSVPPKMRKEESSDSKS